ncbi:gliding motility-associated C-terminal domain-containing protein [Arcicella sp. LKC2W]|uniref:T9SS type B sorting domain-containing protein n=1 Tax=Arcicella sp. LKC2W TaxID=2984198 RepID=UPI002B20D129|nr:gliding motility-associated C-terminal domain-containing protein [Arcicella sp. LKC2W]MEA5459592.1 gliding motility-associated C-terminal domain-containing protein [Arcicella sp. LKC2W]
MIRFSSIQRYFLIFSVIFLSWGLSSNVYAQEFFKVRKTCISECSDTTAATIFRDTLLTPATAWRWEFGDPVSGMKNTSTLKNPAHLYSTAGVKTVTLTRTEGGVPKVYTQTITINNPPTAFYLGNSAAQQDTTICKGDFLTLDPYKNGGAEPKYKYTWYPKGDSTQTLRADTTSCYSVQVTDSTTGCSAQNKINVKLCVPPPPKPAENYWYFGNNAGIKFSSGTPSADDKGKLNTTEGVSSIADPNGNLLFYTDGRKIYDKDGIEMASLKPDVLAGSDVSTQSAVIVPQPSCQGCQSIYYVFTTTDINGTKQLSYSVVDIRQNKGKGKVIEKNVVLDDVPSTEQLISHFVKKDSTYWVISHDYGTDTIRLRRVTKNGVSISKIVQIGSRIDSVAKGEGYIKVSQDGTKFAVAIPGGARNLIEVYDFVDSTGELKNKKVIDLGPAPPTVYGVEFSPDSKTLFATMKADTVKNPNSYSSLLRFDLTDGDSAVIANSKVLIDSSKKEYYGSVQLGPDGRIYLAIQGSTTLGVIKIPNDTISTKSLSIDYYDRKGFDLNGKISQLGLPTTYNVINENNEGVGITAADTCLGSPTNFQTNHLCGEQLKNTKTDWRFYRGEVPADGKPVGSPIATIQGGEGDSGLQTSYTFDAPGKYYVVVNMGNRCKPDTMLPPQAFEVLPLPKPDLGPDLNLCAGSVTLDSKVTLDSSNYFWFRNRQFLSRDSLRTLAVTQSGNYAVLVESRGCIGIDSVQVTLAQAKALNLGADTLICAGSPIVLDASNAAGTGSTFLWSTGATTAKITVSTAGTYSVTVTTPIGATVCTTTDNVNVRIRPKMSFSVNRTSPTGCLANDGTIKIVGLTPTGTYSFVWYKDGVLIANSTLDGITALRAGSYRVTIRSDVTCDTTVAIILNAINTPNPQITLVPTAVTCISDGAINITVNANSPFRPVDFILRQGGTDAILMQGAMASIFVSTGKYVIKGLIAGTYFIEFIDKDGCKFIGNNVILNKIARTDISLLPAPTGKCEGEKITLSPVNYTDGSIRWSTGATTLNIDVSQTGLYIVTITSTDGKCISSARTQVTFKPSPRVSITAPSRLCLTPNSTQLVGSPSGGTWQGSNVDANGIFKVSAIGVYAVKYELTQNGCTGVTNREITVLDAPVFNLGPDKSLCRNSTDLIGVSSPQANVTYRWNSGQTTPTIMPERSGTYILMGTKGLCRSSDTVVVNLLPIPSVSLRSEIPLCVPSTLPVRVDAGGGVGLTYKWSPTGETTRQISVGTVGTYTVLVTNTYGCPITAQTNVIDRCDPSILVPDIFTPNGDNLNDNFQVFPAYIREYNLKIFNRWGELIFTSKHPEDRWDGKYKGTLVKPDSFAWVITYVPEYFPEQGIQSKQGAVTVAW